MDGADAVSLRHGQQQRGHDEDGGVNVHECAHEDEQDVDHQQEAPAAGDVGRDQVGQEGGDTGQRHDLAGHSGEGVQQADNGSGRTGDGATAPEGDLDLLFVDDFQNGEIEDTVNAAHSACLRNGAEAAVDSAIDDDGHQQGRDSVEGGFADLTGFFTERHIDLFRLNLMTADAEVVNDEIAHCKNEGRADGRHPDFRDLAAGGQSVHDAGDTRGNENAQKAGSRQQSGVISLGVALFFQLGHHHLADGGDGSHSRASQNAEGHAGADGDDAGGAADATHKRFDPVDQHLGDAAVFHDDTGEDVERDGQQSKAVQTGERELGHSDQIVAAKSQHQ